MKTERYVVRHSGKFDYRVYLNPESFPPYQQAGVLPVVAGLTQQQAIAVCQRLNSVWTQSELYRSWWNQGMKAHDELAKNWSHVANSNRLYRDECLRLRRLLDSIHAMTQPAVVSPAACKRDWSEQREQM